MQQNTDRDMPESIIDVPMPGNELLLHRQKEMESCTVAYRDCFSIDQKKTKNSLTENRDRNISRQFIEVINYEF